MTGKEEQNELAVPAIKASARLLLMGSHAHSSQQYFSLMSQVSLSGSCKPPTLSHSHYGALLHTTFPLQRYLSAVWRRHFLFHLLGTILRGCNHTGALCNIY